MKAFTFQAPPNILFEAGASKKLAELVAGYGARRVLLVTDKGVRNAGLTKNAEAGLVAGGCELTVFEDVEADPPSHVIERAVALCRDKDIELVASIGGGSALDTAKLVAYLAKTPDRLEDIYGVGHYLDAYKYRYLRWSYLFFLAGFLLAVVTQILRFVR